jgi:hypothetical protein
LDFDEHLRTNPDSEIIGELNRINAVLQDFITDIDTGSHNKLDLLQSLVP